MKCYVILLQDRHTDPYIEVWEDPAAAIARAVKLAMELDLHDSFQPEYVEGWLFYATYGDGNSVRVEEKELR